jgi:antitoxin component of MazEF toxin-antitoxin module
LVNAVVKKWGNSYGVILPVKIVREKDLSENDIIEIRIKKKIRNIEALYGSLKLDRSTQKIKDELRDGWNA